MNGRNQTRTMWGRSAEGWLLPLMLCVGLVLGLRAYAPAQAQAASPESGQTSSSPEVSEVPPAVAKELQAVKVRMAQMESQMKELTAFVAVSPAVAGQPPRSAPTKVTVTGDVRCGHCQGLLPIHKGYTLFTWALNSVSQGDDIVLVAQDRVYKLQGAKDQVLRFMSAKVRVTGRLDGSVLEVETIVRAAKGE
jgi:hypothetical protein